MQIAVKEHIIRTVVVSTADRIDAFSSPELRERVGMLLSDGVGRLVIDLSQVPFLDSAGMAALVSALKQARQQGGDVKLVWPREEGARRILHLTRFDRVFDMAETSDEAIGRF
jgi:anti-sigma B factor antagonist